MKQVRYLLALAIASVFAVFAYAEDFSVDYKGKTIYYKFTDYQKKEVKVTYKGSSHGAKDYAGEVEIPSSVVYNGTTYPVVAVDSYAFDRCDGLTKITLPSSIKKIDTAAFYYCKALTSITLPANLEEIGMSVFQGCPLTSLTIPGKVTKLGSRFMSGTKIESISLPASFSIYDKDVFDCSTLKSFNVDANNEKFKSVDGVLFSKSGKTLYKVPTSYGSSYTVPEGVETLYAYSFSECKATKVTLPSSLINIGEWAFYFAKITELNIPAKVQTIESDVFVNCYSLKKVTISAENPYICLYDNVIYNKEKTMLITGIPSLSTRTQLNIPSTVTVIAAYALDVCNYTRVIIPKTVTTMGENALNLPYLELISLPDSMKVIPDQLLQDCRSLKAIFIPKGVTYIGHNFLQRVEDITVDIYYEGTEAKWKAIERDYFQPSYANTTFHFNAPGLPSSVTPIANVNMDVQKNDGRTYNLQGQIVDDSYRGIVIKDGRKFIRR